MDALDRILNHMREKALSERDKGTGFENLIQAYLTHDALQSKQFAKVMPFAEWAKLHGWRANDTGIDLVAELREPDQNGKPAYAAIQCKFYAAHHKITKEDIDSFISASGKDPFKLRLIVDTSHPQWSDNAAEMIHGQAIKVKRITLTHLREANLDWSQYEHNQTIAANPKKSLREDQIDAVEKVKLGLQSADRGKLIMACGTGKTLTSLRIAENLVGKGGRVLFLVPSLALMAQTVREWTNEAKIPLRSFAVCSDIEVGKRRKDDNDDVTQVPTKDLAFDATTDSVLFAEHANSPKPDHMTVVFATYHSIDVINAAQTKHQLPDFDLIICDEAHRTTGVTFASESESNFVKIHSNENIRGKKRLYMTATPRIYGDSVKSKIRNSHDEDRPALASMDDEAIYGKTLHYFGFAEAVERHLLTDYKVIVLVMDEAQISAAVQKSLEMGGELSLNDATKIIGCYKALAKMDYAANQGDATINTAAPVTMAEPIIPMRRALAFCRNINASKLIVDEFGLVVEKYFQYEAAHNRPVPANSLHCQLKHVDGTFDAKSRGEALQWLNNTPIPTNPNDRPTCHILSNARCLTEGVDVPTLDAIIFMHARKSQIDVVQAVGRVMRKSEGKNQGYVILPVGIPAGMRPEEALRDNEKFRVIWQTLNALRSHDERLEADINRLSLGQNNLNFIDFIMGSLAETAKIDDLPTRSQPSTVEVGGSDVVIPEPSVQAELALTVNELSRAIKAKIVEKCGNREYWEDWATNIAEIAQTHITLLNGVLKDSNSQVRQAFDEFLTELRDDLNDQVSQDDAIEMLAQHIITKPVFDTLFAGNQFTSQNPVSQALTKVLEQLNQNMLNKESKDLNKFYDSVKRRANGITEAAARQKLVVELYDKFFRKAFPHVTAKLGIVYTPVEIVDFIIHSVNDVLRDEFGQSLGSPGVHIIDPFTGTGTFITRLLESGLITREEMTHKYLNEIHANEIVLLAYYIAAINIESTFHAIMENTSTSGDKTAQYQPFPKILLTDTFQMYEKPDLVSQVMVENSERRKRQQELEIKVIIGNPPYSVGQESGNDNNANVSYPNLDERIRTTYADHSRATNKNALYDSYIRAIRWGSDRIGDAGVMGMVTNAGWIESNSADGMRQCVQEEFSDIYVFHLRGNARTQGELRRKEKGNVFAGGSRAPTAISIFVKNPESLEKGRIHFHDIGDYLETNQKLDIIRNFHSINGISESGDWSQIYPDQFNDWIKQRDQSMGAYIKIGDKKDSSSIAIFESYSSGIKTQRDAWCYNSSKIKLERNIDSMVDFYNSEVTRYKSALENENAPNIDQFMDTNPKKISWTYGLKNDLSNLKAISTIKRNFQISSYRPFTKQWLCYEKRIAEMLYRIPSIYPQGKFDNTVICVSGVGSSKNFTALMTDTLPDLELVSKSQCFPLKLYEEIPDEMGDLLTPGTGEKKYRVRDAITDDGLKHFQNHHPGKTITKEDIFYYVYGLLHSQQYREKFKENLTKELPRIPVVKHYPDFVKIRDIGKKLGDLHVNYETARPHYDLVTEITNPEALRQTMETASGPVARKVKIGESYNHQFDYDRILDPTSFFRVEKMQFAKKPAKLGPPKLGKDGNPAKNSTREEKQDKTTVIYNQNLRITNIPKEAYDYVVNGKSAIDWVIVRGIARRFCCGWPP